MNSQINEIKTCNEMEELEKLLSLDGKTILELGCGNAEKTRFIATNGYGRKIKSTEVDTVQHANNLLIDDLPNVEFLVAGAENIPLEDGSIDFVFMFKSLHHVPIQLMGTALTEIQRVLKPGGLAYISEPEFKGAFNEVIRIFHDEEEVRKQAYAAINKTISSKEFLPENELFFNTLTTFENFEDFEEKIINVTHTEHKLSEELTQKSKKQFLLNMGRNGAEFLIPMRVNLLKKPEH